MAIEIELPDGTIAEFPDGMSNEEIEAVLSRQFGAPAEAAPASAPSGTALPEPQGVLAQADAALNSTGLGRGVAEFAAAVNRGAVDLAEFLTTDQIQGIQELIGSESRVPNLREFLPDALKAGLDGGFMQEGLARDAVQVAGGAIPAAVGTAGLLRSAAGMLPAATASEGVIPGALRVLGSDTAGTAAVTGAVSATGGVAGGSVGEAIGGETGRQIGSLLGSIAAPVAGGVAAAKLAPGAPSVATGVASVADDTPVAETIKTTLPDSKAARYIVDGAGKIKADPVARAALRQNIDEGLVAAIKGASPDDKEAMRKMLSIAKQGRANRLYREVNRPGTVVGESVTRRYNEVKAVNNLAAQQLDTVAKNLKGQTVDTSRAVSQFLDDLDNMGITVDEFARPNFKGSDIESRRLKPMQTAIADMLKKIKESGGSEMDAYTAHQIKRIIDEQVGFGKASDSGLSGKTESVLKSLRRAIDTTLDENFAEYNAVNTQYSDTIQALDAFAKVAGPSFNPTSPNASKQAGILARRLLSNAQSVGALMDSLNGLQNTAAKYGAEFKDDIVTQVMFASDLEKIFGPAASTSLAAEVSKGMTDAAIGAATGGSSTASAGAGVLRSAINTARGVNQDNAIKALDELLKPTKAAPKPAK